MNIDIANYFDIPNPDNWYCAIWSYQVSLGLLSIKVVNSVKQEDVKWLTFIDVIYIEAPMMWHGANFHIATVEELKSLPISKRIPNVEKHHMLFKVLFQISSKDNHFEVLKIIAKKPQPV